MGCGGSKSTRTINPTSPAVNGAQTSKGPSSRQIQLVRQTWDDVKPNLGEHGITFYSSHQYYTLTSLEIVCRLFAEHPESQELFPFRDVEGLDKLKEDDRFKFQAKRVMEMVGAAVDGLDDLPSLSIVLKDLGARHVAWNVKEHHYGPVGEALIFTLKTGLGDKFTTEVNEAWLAVYGLIADSMKAGAREAASSS
ncbi:hypothetical protein QZH41_017846 [Actinostola sp. cb2023]|nr:hypothetical protein QZH41_017846 [Actinostola sp. cb2023]